MFNNISTFVFLPIKINKQVNKNKNTLQTNRTEQKQGMNRKPRNN